MRRLLIPLLLLITLAAHAQLNKVIITVNGRKLDETTVVRDSSGNVFPYKSWQEYYQTGKYWFRPVTPGSDTTSYIIVHKQAVRPPKNGVYPRPHESEYFTTGEVIKPFKIRDIYDNKLDAKAWAGKTIVLNYWFINCPPCRAEIPELNKIAAKYTDNPNVIFIGIALDPAFEILNFIKKNPFGYVLVPDGRNLAQMFKIHTFPTNVVIDKTGKVVFHSSGLSQSTVYWIDKSIAESEQIQL